ncbi:unnamed protein product, partial [Ascophyllum nodosum]
MHGPPKISYTGTCIVYIIFIISIGDAAPSRRRSPLPTLASECSTRKEDFS